MSTFAEKDLQQAITDPDYPAEDLIRIFQNRGYRDAVIALAIRSNNWEGLVTAARRSMAERGAQNGEIPYGEFTALAAAAWRSDGSLYPTTGDLKELMLDGPEKEVLMLERLINAQRAGVSFSHWENTMRELNINKCIQFAIQERDKGRG